MSNGYARAFLEYNHMPCITNISNSDMYDHFEKLLCKACKFLTIEQIESLTNPNSGIYDGIMWYTNHLFLDYYCNSNTDVETKNLALKDLQRLGYDIKNLEYGHELIKK